MCGRADRTQVLAVRQAETKKDLSLSSLQSVWGRAWLSLHSQVMPGEAVLQSLSAFWTFRKRVQSRTEEQFVEFQQFRVAPADTEIREFFPGLCRGGSQKSEGPFHRWLMQAPLPRSDEFESRWASHAGHPFGTVKVGSLGSGTSTSRSHPSFSNLMCWMATALAFASKSG